MRPFTRFLRRLFPHEPASRPAAARLQGEWLEERALPSTMPLYVMRHFVRSLTVQQDDRVSLAAGGLVQACPGDQFVSTCRFTSSVGDGDLADDITAPRLRIDATGANGRPDGTFDFVVPGRVVGNDILFTLPRAVQLTLAPIMYRLDAVVTPGADGRIGVRNPVVGGAGLDRTMEVMPNNTVHTVVRFADLSVTATAPPVVTRGQTIPVAITATNAGRAVARGTTASFIFQGHPRCSTWATSRPAAA